MGFEDGLAAGVELEDFGAAVGVEAVAAGAALAESGRDPPSETQPKCVENFGREDQNDFCDQFAAHMTRKRADGIYNLDQRSNMSGVSQSTVAGASVYRVLPILEVHPRGTSSVDRTNPVRNSNLWRAIAS